MTEQEARRILGISAEKEPRRMEYSRQPAGIYRT